MVQTSTDSVLRKAAESFVEDFIDEYAWLGRIAEEHQVNLAVLQGVLKFLKKVPYLRKEKAPINIGLVIDNNKIKLSQSTTINSRPFYISETANFCNLKHIVNGRTLCYLIDCNGIATIREVPQYLVKEKARDSLQEVSLTFDAVCMLTEGADAIVYSSGKIAQIRRNGQWIEPCYLKFDSLTKEGFSTDTLSRLLGVCCKLSEKNTGAVFIVTAEKEVKFCKPMNQEASFVKKELEEIPDDELMEFANVDGAVILSTSGEVLMIGQKLDAPEIGAYEVGSGRGTRHNSASKYSKATKSIALVVSDDGPISLYYRGKLIGQCYEALFG